MKTRKYKTKLQKRLIHKDKYSFDYYHSCFPIRVVEQLGIKKGQVLFWQLDRNKNEVIISLKDE